MTPEEKFGQDVWAVLQKIREYELYFGSKSEPSLFIYSIQEWRDEKIIEHQILNRLQEWGAIKIPELDDGYNGRGYYILQPKFDEIYHIYESGGSYQENGEEKPATTTIKNIPVNVIVADLLSKYQEIEQEKNKIQFFFKTANYGKYILENQKIIDILRPLYQESKENAESYIKICEQFIKKWRIYAKDILEQAEKAGIKDDPNNPLSNEISGVKNKLEREEVSLWESDINDYYSSYFYLVRKFNKLGKSSLLIPKHFKSLESPMEISPVYNNAKEEWDKFKHSRETKVWWAHYQICRLAAGVLDLKQREDYLKDDNVIDGFYKYEFGELTRGNLSSTPIVLHQAKYTLWIKRLHEYLIPRLENPQNEVKSPTLTLVLSDPNTSELNPLAIPEKYEIKVKDREIRVNIYLIGKPYATGSNLEFFEYVRSLPPNTLIKRDKMPNEGDGTNFDGIKEQIINKRFIKILNGLGFKGEILKAFFTNRSDDTLIYRGNIITKLDLDKAGVKIPLFLKELELAHIKNSPE